MIGDKYIYSIDVRDTTTRPTNCTVEYGKVRLRQNDDLDFEIKYKYGDVQYKVRRMLNYMRATGETRLGGILSVLEPVYEYEIEIYREK